ncbi:MAG: L-2-amino-thiazoline-4-carboxylic acid hydrolase [Proteobacteria bacterium]|nr:L-2-amino-thiazoline-4-carboxylic acid hydrolase [Pseudomonadota bacterium]MBU1059999.1 L-2-amino-thiazoline-4-carboxylic acid hydrolase [Pseudomonadota bacterium]
MTTYYQEEFPRQLGFMEKVCGAFYQKKLTERYGEDEAAEIWQSALTELEFLFARLPPLGGKRNFLTPCLTGTMPALALYKALQQHDKNPLEAGNIFYDVIESTYHDGFFGSREELRQEGKEMFSNESLQQMESFSAWLQEKEYPENFVYQYVPGNGQEFDFGWDFTECAVVKFFSQENASDLVPFMCAFDFLESKFKKTGLKRTSTLAENEPVCDFRYKLEE